MHVQLLFLIYMYFVHAVFIDAGSRSEIPFKSGVTHLLSRVAIQVSRSA